PAGPRGPGHRRGPVRGRRPPRRPAGGTAGPDRGRRVGRRADDVDPVAGPPGRRPDPAGCGAARRRTRRLSLGDAGYPGTSASRAPGEVPFVFATLSDRLTSTFKNLRTKGRLS